MSWDVDLIDTNTNQVIKDWNYTHNTNGMIRVVLEEANWNFNWWRDMMNLDGAQGAATLDKIIRGLEADPMRFDQMNPANGWGSRESLVAVLTDMRNSVPERPCHWEVWG